MIKIINKYSLSWFMFWYIIWKFRCPTFFFSLLFFYQFIKVFKLFFVFFIPLVYTYISSVRAYFFIFMICYAQSYWLYNQKMKNLTKNLLFLCYLFLTDQIIMVYKIPETCYFNYFKAAPTYLSSDLCWNS